MGRAANIALLVLALTVASSQGAVAAILFQSTAEEGVCNTGVPSSAWNYTESGDSPNSRMFYRCDAPVPGSGRAKYFRIDTVAGQHDSWNQYFLPQTIALTPGRTYYLGGFFRFDRIDGLDVWEDGFEADSFDKLYEFRGNVRWLVLAGWPNANYPATNHKFTLDLGVSPTYCSNCGNSEKWANVAPYSKTAPFLCDYERWYAVVIAFTPSSGGSAADGTVELFINGIKTSSYKNQKTQDATGPSIESIQHSGTSAQPAYNAPPHSRKMDFFVFADSLTDIQNAGLMSDPEAAALSPPRNLRLQ